MQGSIENPPLIVREYWFSRGALILAVIALTVVSMSHAFDDLWWRQPVPVCVALVCAWGFCAWHCFRPARLEVWPDKLVRVGLFGFRHAYALADIAEFSVCYQSKGGAQVAFTWTKDSPRRTKLAVVSEVFSGVDVMLGGNWELPVQELVDLLNRALLLPSAWR
jgi:hypothetical protein